MKKNLMLLILTTFALVGCGGGGSHSEPLLKQPQANTMSVPEYKALNAKDVKSTNTKSNVTTGTNSNTYETKDYKTFKPTSHIPNDYNVIDLKHMVITENKEVLENKNIITVSKVTPTITSNKQLVSITALTAKKGGAVYNNGKIILTGNAILIKDSKGQIDPEKSTSQLGMLASGGTGTGEALVVNASKGNITVNTANQTAMMASGEGAVAVNYGTINLNGLGETAMVANGKGAIAVNHGTIDLNGNSGVGLKAVTGGKVINAKDGIITLAGSEDTVLASQYKAAGYSVSHTTSAKNFGILTDKDSTFINHGTIKLK